MRRAWAWAKARAIVGHHLLDFPDIAIDLREEGVAAEVRVLLRRMSTRSSVISSHLAMAEAGSDSRMCSMLRGATTSTSALANSMAPAPRTLRVTPVRSLGRPPARPVLIRKIHSQPRHKHFHLSSLSLPVPQPSSPAGSPRPHCPLPIAPVRAAAHAHTHAHARAHAHAHAHARPQARPH
eukprot:663228-Pleurochrysis_carterae.AAC.1